jgi:hypothetical protein
MTGTPGSGSGGADSASSIVIFPPVTYVVTGTITAPGSASVTGLAVQLVDKNVGGDTVLASGQTIPGGSFTIQASITVSYLAQHGKTTPDLQAQALQNGAVAATSIVRYNASTSEQLDIALAAGQLPLASEYEALTAAVTAAYTGSLATLQENGQQQDITFLANKTGWDARAIAMASIATQLASRKRGQGVSASRTALLRAAAGWAAHRSRSVARDRCRVSEDRLVTGHRAERAAQLGRLLARHRPGPVRRHQRGYRRRRATQGRHVDPRQPARLTLRPGPGSSAGVRDHPREQPGRSSHAMGGSKGLGPGITAQPQLDGQPAYLTSTTVRCLTRSIGMRARRSRRRSTW